MNQTPIFSNKIKLVTLVVVSDDGEILGQTQELEVAGPHWQETATVADTFPGAIILRLLTVSVEQDTPRICYLAQFPKNQIPNDLIACELSDDYFVEHDLRMPWAKVGGPQQDLLWATQYVEPEGLAVQDRTWNLSSVWKIPTTTEPVWLKCVPSFFQHEAVVLDVMADQSVPRLLANDKHRLLMSHMAGKDGYSASEEQRCVAVEQLVGLQIQSSQRLTELESRGVPRFSLAELAEVCQRLLIERNATAKTQAFLDSLPHSLSILAQSEISDVLVHGDFHAGNVRVGVSPPIIFDWGDSFIGHPLLDPATVHSKTLVQHWLAMWQREYPDENIAMLWQHIRPLAKLRSALVYQHFLDNIEPTERVYHSEDVDEIIDNFQG